MKDDKLEKKFDEYFEGVNTPDNITDGAKKYVVKRKSLLPKIAKFSSIAASFLLVFTAALLIIFNRPNAKGSDSAQAPGASAPSSPDSSFKPSEGDNSACAPGDSNIGDADVAGFICYDDVNFTQIDTHKNLEFLNELDGATVNERYAGYRQDELTLVKAKVSLNGETTEVYLEYAALNEVYFPLADFYYGTLETYKGTTYYVTQTTVQGGEQQKLCVIYGGVKYYFDISSSKKQAYLKYLDLIIK